MQSTRPASDVCDAGAAGLGTVSSRWSGFGRGAPGLCGILRVVSEPTPPTPAPHEPRADSASTQSSDDETVAVPTAPTAALPTTPAADVEPGPAPGTQPPPVPPGRSVSAGAAGPAPLSPPGPASGSYQLPPPDPSIAPAGGPMPFPGSPGYVQPSDPGANGVAIGSLICGLAGFIPLVGIVAGILGAVALRQLSRRPRRGRGMAISGIVLGAVWTLLWVGLVVIGATADEGDDTSPGLTSAHTTSAPSAGAGPTATHASERVLIDDLAAGDCFDGLPKEQDAAIDYVTTKDCALPHEAQIATRLELAAGKWPGAQKAADLADQRCGDAVEPLLRDDRFDDVDLSYLYPGTAFDWRADRSATCIVSGSSGTLTGSVLK